MSVLTIGLVGGFAFGASRAWFNDTETSTGNSFTTGTIDIEVNDENPWNSTSEYSLTDMKPSQTDYANFTITNVGTNPANVWKKVAIRDKNTGVVTEPECVAENGTWTNDGCNGNTEKNDISTVINYDLSVIVYEEGSETPLWFQTIWEDTDNHTLAQVANSEGRGDLLGMIPPGGRMEVTQSYHMQSETENWAQGDQLTFDINLYAEQLTNTVYMVSKSGADWDNIDQNEVALGTLTYKVKDFDFKYDFEASGLLANTEYVLVSGTNPWNSADTVEVGSFMSDGSGNISELGQAIDFDQNLTNAKVWLILASDWSVDHMTNWNGDSYLFETALIEYFDTDVPTP